MPEPILVHCEGSGVPGHRAICPTGWGMCQMCGQLVLLEIDGRTVDHHRNDILAMIERGDFDA